MEGRIRDYWKCPIADLSHTGYIRIRLLCTFLSARVFPAPHISMTYPLGRPQVIDPSRSPVIGRASTTRVTQQDNNNKSLSTMDPTSPYLGQRTTFPPPPEKLSPYLGIGNNNKRIPKNRIPGNYIPQKSVLPPSHFLLTPPSLLPGSIGVVSKKCWRKSPVIWISKNNRKVHFSSGKRGRRFCYFLCLAFAFFFFYLFLLLVIICPLLRERVVVHFFALPPFRHITRESWHNLFYIFFVGTAIYKYITTNIITFGMVTGRCVRNGFRDLD